MSAWAPYVPSSGDPWNLARVVHLHRRAGFGASWAELQRDLSDGPQLALDRLLSGQTIREGLIDEFEALSATIAKSAVDAEDEHRLKAWWVYRCLTTPDPLGERLTLMWHNHFATSLIKVTNLKWMHRQNESFRRHARGEFGVLLNELLKDPALLSWLDATENRAGQPNENLARELMELFTLGIGNYTEADIREAARSLTGITIDEGEVRLDPARHDAGSKTVLGKSGPFQSRELADLLISHPATARRLAWRLCQEFCGENVIDAAALDELAAGLRTNSLCIGWAVETILRSKAFFSSSNQRSHIADPASFLMGPLRALECYRNPPNTLVVADALRRMGFDLFVPPNVGGWNGGRAWLSTRTVVARTNIVAEFLQGKLQQTVVPFDVTALRRRHQINDSASEVTRFLCRLLFGQVADELVEQIALGVAGEPDRARQDRQILALLLTSAQSHLH